MGCVGISRGFMGRLARDVRGNTLALMAAVMLPLAGLIGGSVDMSRLYLTKTRLQHACDAGALAGRKAMGAGSWTTGTNNNSSNDAAEKMFLANFGEHNYGTGTLGKEFKEADGNVTGTATVPVPMTIMKIFGMQSRTISVTCQAKMELPNTDVMFVLDVTMSMQCKPEDPSEGCDTGVATNIKRITGLRKAVKCFYEALEKVNTPEPCTIVNPAANPITYNSSKDPAATTATTTAQVRIGFVPYGVNVNVGKVLPQSAIADKWTYQSRVPTIGTAHAWALGSTVITPTGNWTPVMPTNFSDTNLYNSFGTVTNNSYTMADGTVVTKNPTTANTSAKCAALNTFGASKLMVGFQESQGSATLNSTTPSNNNPPVWISDTNPAAQNLNATSQSRTNTVTTGFKYVWTSGSCYLQSATKNNSNPKTYNQTQNVTAAKPITWTSYPDAIVKWTYKPVLVDVSGLKKTDGSGGWNGSVKLSSIGSKTKSTDPSVTFSGETTARKAQYPDDATVTWDGCIEEAHTFQDTSSSSPYDWATVPDDAYDMNVNLIPSGTPALIGMKAIVSRAPAIGDPGTYWGPMLAKTSSSNNTINSPFWARYTGSTSNWTRTEVPINSSDPTLQLSQNNYSYYCTTSPARKLTEYRTATDLVSYVDALSANDAGTYHDIGMLWGARLLSPYGIFASENASATTGGAIQRHLIFMTDGITRTVYNNYNAYGLGFHNRYQTYYDPVCNGPGNPATCAYTNDLVNKRLIAICDQVKKMNIKLWVVSYGAAVTGDPATEDRLKKCASDDAHFFASAKTSDLMQAFSTIAAKISELRLTS